MRGRNCSRGRIGGGGGGGGSCGGGGGGGEGGGGWGGGGGFRDWTRKGGRREKLPRRGQGVEYKMKEEWKGNKGDGGWGGGNGGEGKRRVSSEGGRNNERKEKER